MIKTRASERCANRTILAARHQPGRAGLGSDRPVAGTRLSHQAPPALAAGRSDCGTSARYPGAVGGCGTARSDGAGETAGRPGGRASARGAKPAAPGGGAGDTGPADCPPGRRLSGGVKTIGLFAARPPLVSNQQSTPGPGAVLRVPSFLNRSAANQGGQPVPAGYRAICGRDPSAFSQARQPDPGTGRN